MKSPNEDIRKSIEESAPIFRAARRANVALQIRSKMHEKGLKNRDIAERLGVSEANVSRWLRGNQNLSVDTIFQLADALEEPVEIIIGVAKAAQVERDSAFERDSLIEWEARQELEAAAAAPSPGFTTSGRVDNVYSLDPYRTLRRTDYLGRGFVHATCGNGIAVHEEEKVYK